MNKLRGRKAFTIIELIVVIAIIGILVMFAMPRLLGYVQKAQLIRIQHDTRIMEEAMEVEFQDGITQQWKDWDTNYKNLFNIVARQQLFETEGVANNVDMSYMKYKPFISANPEVNPKTIVAAVDGKLNASELLAQKINLEVNLGGPIMGDESGNTDITKEAPHTDYRIIPANFKELINTRLKGGFYVNALGKVYYEPNKPLTIKGSDKENVPSCSVALPDYEFDHLTGTIKKYKGDEQHVVIPPAFLANGQCFVVRIIGKGAFMQGDYKSIVVPEGVIIFEEDAIKGDTLDRVVIKRPIDYVEIPPGAIENTNPKNPGGKPKPIVPEYNEPSYYEDIIAKPKKNKDGSITGGIIIDGGIDNSGPPNNLSGGVIVIPDYVVIEGEKVPVKEIAKGAYQGKGLISVLLPESLERIEDYAFSGNQLIGVTIPKSVNYIGHYAFSFNEVIKIGNIAGPRKISTIKTVIMKDIEQFNKINNYGNILENGNKLDKLSVDDGVDITLRNYIFVTSISHKVIDEEYVGDDLPVDKSLLMQTLEQAKLLNKDNYRQDYHWIRLEDAMNYAQKVIDHPDVKQGQINYATDRLIKAINALNEVANKEALIALIEKAEGIENEDYYNWDIFASRLNSAKIVRDNKKASQTQVDAVTNTLQKAIDSLFATDKKELNDLITQAEKLNETDYKDGWTSLTRQLQAAIQVKDNHKSTQSQINTAANNLQKAIDTLVHIPENYTYIFHGEVPASEFITGDDLANQIELTAGKVTVDKITKESYSNEPWLKFTKTSNVGISTTMYVAKKPYRLGISWKHIDEVGAIFGDSPKTQALDIKGNKYKVRLMQGSSVNPSSSSGSDMWGSEWNKMMLPIHEEVLDAGWRNPNNVNPDLQPLYHDYGSGKNGMYTNVDLLSQGNDSYSWTQESSKTNETYRLMRGGGGISFSVFRSDSFTTSNLNANWRPILELVK